MEASESPRNHDGVSGPAVGRTVRIFLMDDSPIIRMGIRAIVESASGLELVGATHDGTVSPNDIQKLAPDLIVVNSLSLSKERLDQVSHLSDSSSLMIPRILMIVGERENLTSSGTRVDGTVQIRARPDEFIAAINLVAAGYSIAAPEQGRSAEAATLVARTPHWKTIQLLTRREIDVLRALAQGCTNAEIARLMRVSESTVKSHVQNLLAKLGLPNRSSAVALAYEAGMINGGQVLPGVPSAAPPARSGRSADPLAAG
jgi:DNA-binding NarL/FixJ family response regulator